MANEEEYEIDEEQRGLRHVGRGPLAEKGTQTPALVGELVSALNRMFPPADAEPWDRTGLLVGDPSAKIEGVACALDPTVSAVREAAQLGANVLVTHILRFSTLPMSSCRFRLVPACRVRWCSKRRAWVWRLRIGTRRSM